MRCIILDDEPFAHQVLEVYINDTPGLELAAGFRNAVEAYEYLNKHTVDLLFLDIEMPLVNGISFLKALKVKPTTIFTTAYKQYAFEGFELGVIDYLLKPFSYDRFLTAIEKTNQTSPDISSGDTIAIREKVGIANILQSGILYIEGLKDYIRIVTVEREYVVYHTLKGILAKLNPNIFLQCHRSFILNKTFIVRINQDIVICRDQSNFPIGSSFKKKFLESLNKGGG